VDKVHDEKESQSVEPQNQMAASESKRLPVPDEATQLKIAKELAAVYDVAHVKTAQKATLARQLLDAVQNTQSKPNEQFVLLQQATELAADTGDAATLTEAVEMLTGRFEVNQTEKMGKSLIECANNAKSANHIGSLVANARRVIDQAALDGRYELASELADAVYRACQRSPGKEFRKEAADQRNWVQEYCRRQKRRQQAQAAVKADPNDAKAHLALGRYYCLDDNWQEALPHLAKGGDADLQQLAQRELASPAEPTEQVKLADAWWELAQNREGTERDSLLLRAGYWYDLAHPKLTSAIVRLKVEKRLEELVEIRQRHIADNQRRVHSGNGSAQSLWNNPR
jgi:hypothetical protein